ncbi:hypothetical protein AHMF7605_11825 [Adhaeribacter arboris]|uniref:Uncharacterized protein n=1 Tax=Adhaeribacter arboris TaxID=2072846 RepID=A0A2T2YF73_9BACT|nr:hypothetical protein [Adhaeribacter arboris]PSR54160.1 hypothetical protein AHMF7605_11825 [Adhaeribacter arboris]
MGLGYNYTKKTLNDIPVWQRNGGQMSAVQGGFGLDRTGLPDGYVIPAGCPMIANETTRLAKPLVVGTVVETAGGSATTYKVNKNSPLAIGQNFAAKPGNKAYPITAIDKTNADYDVVTVGTTIGAVNAGELVFASSTTGASNSSFGGVNSVNYADKIVRDGESITVVIANPNNPLYAKRVPYSPELEAALPRIIYSQSL